MGLSVDDIIEVKALVLLSTLAISWEVFGKTVTNSSFELMLYKTIGMVLDQKNFGKKSMELSIDNLTKAHYSREATTTS